MSRAAGQQRSARYSSTGCWQIGSGSPARRTLQDALDVAEVEPVRHDRLVERALDASIRHDRAEVEQRPRDGRDRHAAQYIVRGVRAAWPASPPSSPALRIRPPPART
jgi:hypothetical protein